MSTSSIVRINAHAALDASGWHAGPTVALIELRPLAGHAISLWPCPLPLPAARGTLSVRLLTPERADAELSDVPPGVVQTIHRPCHVLMPGLVNAHTHLDLTHLGPFPAGRGSFGSFFPRVREGRLTDPHEIAKSVRMGIELSLSGGVVAVGDIAGCPPSTGPSVAPFLALAESPLLGVSYLEFFAIGTRETESLDRLEHVWADVRSRADRSHGVRPGLHPHAPYSVSLAGYARAIELASRDGAPISTHLAESPAEHELIARAAGPFRAFLESLGLWSDRLLADFGHGKTPIEHLRPVFLQATARGIRPLLIHLNNLSDDDASAVARHAHAAYCPRSSAYFNTERSFGPHPYRQLLNSMGVPVCLGTDSILNVEGPGLSPLDDARLLFRRDAIDPTTLAAMLTTHGANALGLDVDRFRFGAGGSPAPLAGIVAIPLADAQGPEDVFLSDARPELLAISR